MAYEVAVVIDIRKHRVIMRLQYLSREDIRQSIADVFVYDIAGVELKLL